VTVLVLPHPGVANRVMAARPSRSRSACFTASV
jgi:hypothetical protein